MSLLKTSNIFTTQNFKTVRIEMHNLQPDLYNLKTRKELKIYLIVRIELSLNENTLKSLKHK